ncbi:MAG: CusA/CzcA family heavy metal efflux RND transporter [Bryobacteraceae bacterium]|nr:CusA/CzcA family heavy metal efflux RND transporter [Bryobacteraceae bacterium]
MIDAIIEFSARNRFLVVLGAAALAALGWHSMQTVALDAIPDLSDTQVIIASRWDRSPDILEDQVTYPIVAAMLGAPKVRSVRGFSDFGYSYVYVIFEDGTDIYWARSRVLELLSAVLPRLPQGVQTELGPDATGLGWVFQYALVDRTGRHSLAELRSLQDWTLRYALKSVPGVAEVASLGGFVRQYQVQVDPQRLRAFGIPIGQVVEAVRRSNGDTGGRLIEMAGAEYMIRGRGYARSKEDLERTVLKVSANGVPVRVSDVGRVTLGPDLRRGVADLNGEGEVAAGIVVMRDGENALRVIGRVKQRLEELKRALPEGVEIVTTYDRSELILRSIGTLKRALAEELAVVSLVILVFLWHLPSAIIPILTIPMAVLITFVPMKAMGITANIMSLGGIAIAIGAMVDAAIVVVEQTHKKLEQWEREGRPGDARDVVIAAVKEVGGPSFYALLVIAVSFLPVLALEAQEGRLFRPLAWTKNLSMIAAALLAITLDPAVRLLFTHMGEFRFRPRWLARAATAVLVGRIRPEESHPVSRLLIAAYEPACRAALRHRYAVIIGAVALVVATVPVFRRLGSEFMPPLDEGALFYMPVTMPGLGITEAGRLLQMQDRLLKEFPEVELVFGKAGRAETATDPAPLSMFETVILLKPPSRWRPGMTRDRLVEEMHGKLSLPGVSNAWTMPIKARIDMLTTGIRTPAGIKIYGRDLGEIERIGLRIEELLKRVEGTRSVYAERVTGGYFVDFAWKRDALARYGLTVDEAQMLVMNAIGGDSVTTTVEGRERYPVNVRYYRGYREDLAALREALVPALGGRAFVPVKELAEVRVASGPGMIRNENGMLAGYVFIDIEGSDIGSYVERARRALAEKLKTAPGYWLEWSGQYEAMERVREKLKLVLPLTLVLIVALLYLNTRSAVKTMIVLLAVPFSAVGAVWLLDWLGYNLSIGVWVGLIALLGVDAETGVFMLLYLDLSYEEAKRAGRLTNAAELREAVVHGAVKRIRPKFMTVATMLAGLMPLMWAAGAGADVMKRIGAPMVGGVVTSFVLELLVYPAIYEVWKWHAEVKKQVSC